MSSDLYPEIIAIIIIEKGHNMFKKKKQTLIYCTYHKLL